jgi:serine-type D-Ala-D-Ala carboxypeptidase
MILSKTRKHKSIAMDIKINYTKRLSLLFVLITFVLQAGAQQSADKEKRNLLIATVDSILQSQVDSNKIPGAVIEIKKDNRVIYKQAYGYAQKYSYGNQLLAQPEVMTTETLFDIASLTKVIGTTTSIMLLVDRRLISVDDAVGKYIPAFNVGEKRQITIRHLLTHTSGLYEWYPLYYHASNKQETYKLIGQLPLKFPVGTQRKYSDLGFTILGEIIEAVSGLPLDQFMRQNIFIPLGMDHTTYNPLKTGQFTKIAATSHGNPYEHRMVYDTSLGFVFSDVDPTQWNGWRIYTLRGEVNDGNAWYANGGVSGAAGLFSTIDDLQKLVDMLMNRGKAGSKQFITEKTVQLFLSKDSFKNGLGWMMDNANAFMKDGPEGTFGHTGFTGTSIAVIPYFNVSVILLINRQNLGLLPGGEYYNTNPIRFQVFDAVLNYCK